MHPHYVPITDAALLLARFGAALPEGGSPCPEAPGELDMPLLMPAQTKPAGAVGEVRLGRLGLLSRRAVDLSLGGQATHCAIETMKSLATFRESWWAGQRCVVPVMGLQAWSFSTGSLSAGPCSSRPACRWRWPGCGTLGRDRTAPSGPPSVC